MLAGDMVDAVFSGHWEFSSFVERFCRYSTCMGWTPFFTPKIFRPMGGRHPRLLAGAEPLPRSSVQIRAGVTHLFVELSKLSKGTGFPNH